MTLTIRLLSAALSCALLAGCATGFKATHDHDSNHDFAGYKTFGWISENPMKVGPSVRSPNPLLQPRIMNAVEVALGDKGYRLVNDAEKADFALSFTVGSREKIRVDSYPTMSMGYATGYPGHWGWGAAYHCCASDTQVREYTTGILAIDIFDVKERRPVWHGAASKTINEKDRKNMDQTVTDAVNAILAGFPPQ
jgi:hypothetical protein